MLYRPVPFSLRLVLKNTLDGINTNRGIEFNGMKKNISFYEYLFFAEAWLLLALARLILLLIPFKKILPLLGKQISNNEVGIIENTNSLQHISIAIARASRYSFWRTKCFEQALAAKLMLRIRKRISTIYFGVKKNETDNGTCLVNLWRHHYYRWKKYWTI